MENTTYEEVMQQFYGMIHKKVHEMYKNDDPGREPFGVFISRKENEIIQGGRALIEKVSQALQIIVRELTAHHDSHTIEQIKEGLRLVAAKFPKHSEEWGIDSSKTMAEIFGYDVSLLEKIYQVGNSCFKQGQVDEARKVIEFLILLNPGFSASWIALGLILEVQKHWQECIHAFQVASQIDQENPVPYYHSALCYKALKRRQEAKEELHKASNFAKNRQEYTKLLHAVQAEMNKL
jgi:type III secretion system low calcium response chaperone LcrH/SycD